MLYGIICVYLLAKAYECNVRYFILHRNVPLRSDVVQFFAVFAAQKICSLNPSLSLSRSLAHPLATDTPAPLTLSLTHTLPPLRLPSSVFYSYYRWSLHFPSSTKALNMLQRCTRNFIPCCSSFQKQQQKFPPIFHNNIQLIYRETDKENFDRFHSIFPFSPHPFPPSYALHTNIAQFDNKNRSNNNNNNNNPRIFVQFFFQLRIYISGFTAGRL